MWTIKIESIISVFVVGIFILMGFAVIDFTVEGSDEVIGDNPIANGFLEGELFLHPCRKSLCKQ